MIETIQERPNQVGRVEAGDFRQRTYVHAEINVERQDSSRNNIMNHPTAQATNTSGPLYEYCIASIASACFGRVAIRRSGQAA